MKFTFCLWTEIKAQFGDEYGIMKFIFDSDLILMLGSKSVFLRGCKSDHLYGRILQLIQYK